MPSEILENISLYCAISLAHFRLFNLQLRWLDPQQREDPVLPFCHGGPCKNWRLIRLVCCFLSVCSKYYSKTNTHVLQFSSCVANLCPVSWPSSILDISTQHIPTMLAQFICSIDRTAEISKNSDFLTPGHTCLPISFKAWRLGSYYPSVKAVKCHDILSRANGSNIETSRKAESKFASRISAGRRFQDMVRRR